jgi:hypothetical protein
MLLEHGTDVTARHPAGRSLTQVAHDKGFQETARLLQQRGAGGKSWEARKHFLGAAPRTSGVGLLTPTRSASEGS